MIPSISSHTDDTKSTFKSVSENDSDGLLPGCWLETPWDPSTIGSVTEQSRLIDLIPLLQVQWIRTFLFWVVLIAITIGLGIFGPMALTDFKFPPLNPIELGRSGLDRWLEGIILFLASGTAYLTWQIRRQKPECFTRGYILLTITIVCLYMSIDRTTHIADTLIQCVNTILNPPLDYKGGLFWESIVYGAIYLALLSRLLIEFSGIPIAQAFLLFATGGYLCSCGVWFAPEDWKLPFTTQILSGSLTLISDFFLFWSLMNYARFLILDGFGLTGYNRRKLSVQYARTRVDHKLPITEKTFESGNTNSFDKPQNTDVQKESITSNNIEQTNTYSTSNMNSVHTITKNEGTVSSILNSPITTNEKSSISNEAKTYSSTTHDSLSTTAEKITPFVHVNTSSFTNNSSQSATNVTNSTQSVSSAYRQVPQATQPSQYPQASPLYTQPQYGNQQYPQPYSQQPYSQPPYNQSYNSPYGIPPTNGQMGYEQSQPFIQSSYSQSPSYPQPYMPQQSVSQQPIQAVIPQMTQNVVQQPNSQQHINTTTQDSFLPNQLPPSLSILEIQNEFRMLEEKIHRPLTHEEKKAIVCRLIKAHQNK